MLLTKKRNALVVLADILSLKTLFLVIKKNSSCIENPLKHLKWSVLPK